MCGIAGMFGNGVSSDKLTRMVQVMHSRGLDDSGLWIALEQGIALGHARLSLIDLSAAGHQPMTLDPTGTRPLLRIVFDGEIYNYKELRGELENKGAIFKTRSDTEMILWGWHFWGKDTPKYLRGMFAFAVWDEAEKILFFVRDRFGMKPLLWWQKDGQVLFGSSLKAVLASGDIPKILNKQGLFDYLLQGSVLQPRTMIEGVHSLDTATVQSFRFRNGHITTDKEKYWDLKRDVSLSAELARMPYQEQVARLRSELEEACRCHLIADVPTASWLSGGIDSTTITALMSRLSSEKIKSFSIGFSAETGMKNELDDARLAAKYIGTDHTEVVVSGSDVAENFADFIDVLDQPSPDGLNTYLVSKVTREAGLKVALSGLGADESLAGYGLSTYFTREERSRKIGVAEVLHYVRYLAIERFIPYPDRYAQRLMKPDVFFEKFRRMMSEKQMLGALTNSMSKGFDSEHLKKYLASLGLVDTEDFYRLAEYDCKNYLLNTLLRDTDALSMGLGLGVRSIFLDHKLFATMLALPQESKIQNGVGKIILRDVARGLIPPELLQRRKTGFGLPQNYWVEKNLQDVFQEAIRSDIANAIFKQGFLKPFQTGQGKNRYKWSLLALLAWMQRMNVGL